VSGVAVRRPVDILRASPLNPTCAALSWAFGEAALYFPHAAAFVAVFPAFQGRCAGIEI
jgi:hypothetical protein